MFYLNSTLNFGILPVLVFQLEVYYKVDRLLTGLTAQQKGTTAQWYSNKTSLLFMRKKMEMFNFVLDSFKRGIFDFKVKRQGLIAGTVISKVQTFSSNS